MLKKKTGHKSKSAFDAFKSGTTGASSEDQDPLAITEADLESFDTPIKKCKRAASESPTWSKKVIFKNGKVQLIESLPGAGGSSSSTKKNKKSEPVVKFTTVAAKKFIPEVSKSPVSTNNKKTPISILKKAAKTKVSSTKNTQKSKSRERYSRREAPIYLGESSPSPSPTRATKKSLSTAGYIDKSKSNKKGTNRGSNTKLTSKREPSVVLNNFCETANPKVLLTNCTSKTSLPSIILTSLKNKKSVGTKNKTGQKQVNHKSSKKKNSTNQLVQAKMLLKRNKRSSKPVKHRASPIKKTKTNIIKRNNKTIGPKSSKKKVTLEDYAKILKKYKKLLPEIAPVVKLKRLTFKASHHTGEKFRLPSDVDLIRDSSALYDILGVIFQNMDILDKYNALAVCRLWNRAGKEERAWKKLIFCNKTLSRIKPLERIILKHDTETLCFQNVSVCEDTISYDFCRLSSVKNVTCTETDAHFMKNLLKSCSDLESVTILDETIDILHEASSSIKTILAPTGIVTHETAKILKRFNDLEKLDLYSFDPESYHIMGLLLSLKELTLHDLYITHEIDSFIENIPNIEYICFSPIYKSENEYDDYFNKKLVEAFKRCPSLKKLVWIVYEEIIVVIKKKPEEAEYKKKENIITCPSAHLTTEDNTGVAFYKQQVELMDVAQNKDEITEPATNMDTETVENSITTLPLCEGSNANVPQTTQSIPYSEVQSELMQADMIQTESSVTTNILDKVSEISDDSSATASQHVPETVGCIPKQLKENNLSVGTGTEVMEVDNTKSGDIPSVDESLKNEVIHNEKQPIDDDGAKKIDNSLNMFTIEKTYQIKKEDQIDDDANGFQETFKDNTENKPLNNTEDMEDDAPKFRVELLKKLAFKIYLKSSLPECELEFKIIKRFKYVKDNVK